MRNLGLALALAACGGSSPARSTTPGDDAPEPIHMRAPSETQAAEAAADTSACGSRTDMFGPFQLTAEQAQVRYGQGAKTYADAPTTKQRAVEVCGIQASRAWLGAVTCADGSAGNQLGRVGSMGQGGRCGAIIDLYEVQCPEKTYEVFIDIYQCTDGETFP